MLNGLSLCGAIRSVVRVRRDIGAPHAQSGAELCGQACCRLLPHVPFVILLLTLLAIPRAASAQAPGDAARLTSLLANARQYVQRFQEEFLQIVSTERYQQTVRRNGRPNAQRRQLLSETFFVNLDDARMWMTVRNVLRVDGRAVRDSRERIVSALSSNGANRTSRLRALAAEGARFNIGVVARTVNEPTLALMFLDPLHRFRFEFGLEGRDVVDGHEVYRIRFAEILRPSIIRDERDNIDALVSGRFFVAESGEVRRTELRASIGRRVTARIDVDYRRDPRLDRLVPATMEESYQNDDGKGRGITFILCQATYSDYRRFETTGRVIRPE